MKNTLKDSLASLLPAISAAIFPLLTFAQIAAPTPPSAVTSLTGFQTFLCSTVFVWMFSFLIVLAVIFVLVAAFKYLTAAGDPEKVKGASHQLLYAAIAVVVALVAKAVPTLVNSILGGSGSLGC